MRPRPARRLTRPIGLLLAAGVLGGVLLPGSVAEPAQADSIRDRQYWARQPRYQRRLGRFAR